MKINPNDPASPLPNPSDGQYMKGVDYTGLTKLEAFTMAAMQGLCHGYFKKENDIKLAEIAAASVFIAIETIQALNEQTP